MFTTQVATAITIARKCGAERRANADLRPMRTVVSSLRCKLGDDADSPFYIFTEPRAGYRIPAGNG